MALVVGTNLMSMRAQHALTRNQNVLGQVFERISSGQRINRAADDAAGFGMAERFDAEKRGLRQAIRNTNDGISIVQVIEGMTTELAGLVKRTRELAVQAASETLGSTERGYANTEYSQLAAEYRRAINAVGGQTLEKLGFVEPDPGGEGYNPTSALLAGSLSVQVGTSNNANDRIAYPVLEAVTMISAVEDGLNTTYNLSSTTAALAALDFLDTALSSLNTVRAATGATQNRLESAIRSLETYTENLTAAESRIRDADFAFETAELARRQLLTQAGVAVLAQANAINRSVLRLIG